MGVFAVPRNFPIVGVSACTKPPFLLIIGFSTPAPGTSLTCLLDRAGQMRRVTLGKSSQTFTPQKWEPSVQMGVVTPARR